jgi:FAD/FMN-containing dehydrogenase
MPHFALEIVLKHNAASVRPLAGDHPSYALIELASPQQDADLAAVFEEVIGAAIEEGLVEDATIASSDAQRLALWDLRERLSEVQRYEGGSIKHDVSVPVSRVAEFVDRATAACEAEMPGVRVCAFGHFGDGNIHFNLSQPVAMERGASFAPGRTSTASSTTSCARCTARSRPSTGSVSSSATSFRTTRTRWRSS